MIAFTPANIRTWSMLGSCGAFGMAALDFPEIDDRTVIVTADLCTFSGLDRFRGKYPDRLYNVGIAEQNMIGVAAGLSKEGCNVFATTYATFASTRSCDPVRVHLGYMQFGIKLVGLTSGLSVGILGATHMSIEDLAIMRSIPNMTVLSPADCTETVKATLAAARHDGPVYLRLTGGMNNPIVYRDDYSFQIGKAIILREGGDVAIVATGTMVNQALEAARLLEAQGMSAAVIDMHTIKPLDTAVLDAVFATAKLIVTVEEHSVIGGLGGAVAEYKSRQKQSPPQLTIGIEDFFPHAGEYGYLLERCGLAAAQIARRIAVAFAV
jgi:transketolase